MQQLQIKGKINYKGSQVVAYKDEKGEEENGPAQIHVSRRLSRWFGLERSSKGGGGQWIDLKLEVKIPKIFLYIYFSAEFQRENHSGFGLEHLHHTFMNYICCLFIRGLEEDHAKGHGDKNDIMVSVFSNQLGPYMELTYALKPNSLDELHHIRHEVCRNRTF